MGMTLLMMNVITAGYMSFIKNLLIVRTMVRIHALDNQAIKFYVYIIDPFCTPLSNKTPTIKQSSSRVLTSLEEKDKKKTEKQHPAATKSRQGMSTCMFIQLHAYMQLHKIWN